MITLRLPVFEIATYYADPGLFKSIFGEDPVAFAAELEEIMEDPKLSAAINIRVWWEILSIEDTGEIIWKANKLPIGVSKLTLGAIPSSAEAYVIVQRLLETLGEAVILAPGTMAMSGALAAKGKFIVKPIVEVVAGVCPNHPERDIVELYQSADANTYEVMMGLAMDSDGCWVPRDWLVKSDGTVVAIDEPHTHYFGARLSVEAAADYVRAHIADEEE